MSQNQSIAAVGSITGQNPISTGKAASFATGHGQVRSPEQPAGLWSRVTAFSRSAGLARSTTLIGRAFFSAIFLMSVAGHFKSATIGYAAHQGVPFAGFLVPASGLLALAGGLSVLLGYRAKIGAGLLVLFLVPVTLMMHNFWTVSDPMMRQMQMAMFMKNVALLGAALLVFNAGPGAVSLDARREAKSAGTNTDNA